MTRSVNSGWRISISITQMMPRSSLISQRDATDETHLKRNGLRIIGLFQRPPYRRSDQIRPYSKYVSETGPIR